MKFLLCVAMVLSMFGIPNQEAKVIAKECYLYSSASFSSEKVLNENQENIILHHGDKVVVLNEEEEFVLVKTEGQSEGYVYKYYLSTTSSQDVYPVFNATVRRNSTLYDLNKQTTEMEIKEGSRVFLYKGFKDENEYTSVQVVLEDGSLYNGLMLSQDLNPDGINSLLIVGISIICTAVTIILTLVFIKKNKKKKQN